MSGLSSLGQQGVQQVNVTNPKYPEFFDAPFQSQLKSLVQGSRAESLPDEQSAGSRPKPGGRMKSSRVLIYDAKVQEFETNGETKLVIETPRCIYGNHVVSSAEPLHVQTGDGKFMTDGTGFLYVQTNGLLFISNRVHTFIQSELLTNGTSGTAPKIGDLEITSDRLVFETNGIARYISHAHVSSTNLSLDGGSILVLAPSEQKQLQSVTVETNVVMDYENIHVQGQHAIYTAQDHIARVTGHPEWRSEDRHGRGDELVVDATNKIFRANGNAYFQFTTTNSNFIPTQASSSGSTNPAANRNVQITSDFYEFHTNHAQFGDHVILTEMADAQPQGTMTCSALEVAFTGTNELQSMIARTNVVIRDGANQLAGAVATYTAVTRILELTGNPTWKSTEKQGKGRIIDITPYDRKMVVRGDAWAQVPAKELGSAASFGTNRPAKTSPARNSGAEEFADIYSDEYTIKTNQARFVHHVRVIHPQMNLQCNRMAIDSESPSADDMTLLAEDSVTFVVTDEKQRPVHGSCDRVEYTHNDTVQPLIDRMEMTGHPVLETTNSVLRNGIIIFDKTTGQIYLPGQYAMSGTGTPFGTNSPSKAPRKR